MKDKVKKDIEKWTNLTNEITENWIRDYFEIEEDEEIYFDWVANDTGTIFSFADYWFDFNTVLKCYELDITREQLFAWYDFCLSNHSVNISLARFILSPEERKEAEEKHLAELKERVE
jgi:hypothetical protein